VNAETPITFGRTLQRWRSAEFIVTETLHPAAFRLPPHEHEAANVTIVLRGGFEERVEQRSFAAQRGSVIVKPAGARHANVYGSCEVECVTIEVPPSFDIAETRHVRTPLFALAAERLRDDDSKFAAEELVHGIIGTAHELRESHAEWLSTVEQILREEREAPSLSALAAAVERHPAHVAREFRARFGCSVGAFVRARRVDAARDALRETDRPIAAIAIDAGFYDQSHFTNVFRRLLGMTPERYRSRTQRSSKT